MPVSLPEVGARKHLYIVLLAWVVFLLLAAWVLPPLDSHLRPPPLVGWSVVALFVLLALLTAVVAPAYLYRSWLKLPTAPNKTVYALWMGLETLLLLAVPIWLAFLFFSSRAR
jgi:hypothetical protein